MTPLCVCVNLCIQIYILPALVLQWVVHPFS